MRSRRGSAALVAVALLSILAACGGSGALRPSTSGQHVTAASVALLQSADCNLWRVMSSGERHSLLAGFANFFGGRVGSANAAGQRGSILSERRANAALTRYCRLPFAGSFKLYKIYGRAAAFTASG